MLELRVVAVSPTTIVALALLRSSVVQLSLALLRKVPQSVHVATLLLLLSLV